MVGYAGWTMERTAINDATIPILADGIKWLGYAPKKHLLWNRFFGDSLTSPRIRRSRPTPASSWGASPGFRWQTTVLHIGISGRIGKPDDERAAGAFAPESYSLHGTSSIPVSSPSTSRRRADLEICPAGRHLLFGMDDSFRRMTPRSGQSGVQRRQCRGNVADHRRKPTVTKHEAESRSGVGGAPGLREVQAASRS